MVDVDPIIRLLSELVSDGDSAFVQQHGEAALETALEIQTAIMEQFEQSLSYVVLWEQFLQTPHEVADAVANVVRSQADDDPLLAGWLQAAWARYQAQAGASAS